MGSKQYMNFYVHFFYDYAILCMFFISKSLDLRSTSEGSDQIWRNSMFSCGV